ncbi:LPS export ABC transporter permease LptF [Rhodobaculum claviforme]|uniref:LPS export ABC transporter permease LptF n=1 Tax=Rhodobaculum claviforme TaxID=1549854 RepID=A0A934WHQ1_9RHOB|nr:LPS export ABC transporter permease LptF [Rhodobaculum claviforme]
MTGFDRYLLSRLLVLFGFFALVLVAVYWVNRAVSLVDSLIADGQSVRVFLEFTALTLPNVTRLVLPVAGFVAAVYAVHRMVTESEFVVMQATGLSPFRLARPVLVFGLIVAVMLGGLLHWLVPASRAQMNERRAEIAENITSRVLTEGAFVHPTAGVTLYVREITPEGTFRDLFMSDGRAGGPRTIYIAREAVLVRTPLGPQMVMLDGSAQSLRQPGDRLGVTTFDTLTYDLAALVGPRGPLMLGLRDMSTRRILALEDEALDAIGATRDTARAEVHGRTAQPLMATAAALIGFAALTLGAFSRLGVWRQVLGGVVAVIAMQFLHTAVTGAVARDAALWPLVYAPAAAGFAGVAGALWLAGRPRRPRALPAAEGAA